MLIIESRVGFGFADSRPWCVRSSWERRFIGSALSVEMYRAAPETPRGAGSCTDRRSVNRNWVLPAPLGGVSETWSIL